MYLGNSIVESEPNGIMLAATGGFHWNQYRDFHNMIPSNILTVCSQDGDRPSAGA